MMKEGLSPGVQYLMVLGHDVAGIIDEVGKDVVRGKPGQRVVFRESFYQNCYLVPLNTNIYLGCLDYE